MAHISNTPSSYYWIDFKHLQRKLSDVTSYIKNIVARYIGFGNKLSQV